MEFHISLALAELRSTTCSLETVLLAFLHSGVAGQETGSLQSGAVALVNEEESAGNAVTDSAGLAGNAAACDGALDVNLIGEANGDQGLTNDELQGVKAEIIVDVTAVDGDNAGAAGNEVNSGDRGLATAGAVHIGSLGYVSCHYMLPPSLAIPNFGLLGLVLVLGATVNLQTGELVSSQLVLLQHALNCEGHCELGLLCHQFLVLDVLEAANPTGMMIVVLLLQLLAGQNCLFSVDNDDEVTAVNVGGVHGVELAAENVSGENSGLAHGLASCVKDIPLALDGLLLGQGSGHLRFLH